MSVYSMTGFGHTSATDALPVELDIRSVNSRFLDLSFKLSDELRHFEAPLREWVSGRVKRGKVEVRAFVQKRGNIQSAMPSAAAIEALKAAQAAILTHLPGARALSVADVLRLAESDAASPDMSAGVMQAASAALTAMIESRGREGAKLAATLVTHVRAIRELAMQATPLIPALVAQQQQKFIDKFNQAIRAAQTLSAGDTAASPASHSPVSLEAARERALTEATAYAIRIDVDEELSRLNAHLDEIERLLSNGGELGKRLEFIVQELHREANTLGAKSAALPLTRISVDMKVRIEQLREQVQNLE